MTPGSAVEEPSGSLGAAIARAARLLESDAAQAGDQANEILQVFPANRDARLILGASLRAQDRLEEAVAVLSKLAAAEPAWPEARLALGRTLMKQGALAPAIEAYRAAAELAPLKPEAWRALADALHRAGRLVEADAAYMEGVRVSASDPRLVQAADALLKNDIPQAEHLLRTHLKKYPTDIAAMRMLAEVAARLKRYAQAETLLARCLELAPSFHAARHNCAMVLHMQAKSAEALAHIEILLAREPENPSLRALKAAALVRIGDYDEALAIYAALRDEIPDDPGPWLSYGHALKTTGRQAESIAAYRKCVALAPQFGEAYWSLANLKTFAFAPEEIAAMRKALTAPNLSREDEFHLHFALGKALEDAGQHAESFAHYAKGNALRRALIHYEADETSAMLAQSKQVFTAPFFAARQGWGAEAADPIFVVGLPRAGSTLIEQILASHSLVEGTMELPDLPAIVKSFGERRRKDETPKYPAAVETLTAEEARALGERYLETTRVQRKTDRPFFIDKLPNNFAYAGLIHLILPNAKIVDARRHPLGNCFSAYKQHFARGQSFSYDLEDLGRYYRDYVSLMAHMEAVAPGRIHRVIYEEMVADTEAEVRRLLAYCGLEFEPACLSFHQTERAVRTASSEQVRQPIYADSVGHWRHYEPWLEPLKRALGPVLEAYPNAPMEAQ